jgi:hypothetical protein
VRPQDGGSERYLIWLRAAGCAINHKPVLFENRESS